MTEPIDPPEGEVEGPIEPVPGGQPEGEPQPWMPMPGTYGSRNAGRRQSILETFAQVAKMSDVDNAVDGVLDDVHNLGAVVADYGSALERKVEPWAVPTVAPLSQTINRRADATFQLSDFMSPMVRGRSDQGGHNHQHDTTSTAWGLAEGWNQAEQGYVAFITPAINRAYEQIHFMVGAVTGTPAVMDLAIYVVDENRILHRHVNIRVSDLIGSGRQLVTVPFDRWVATQGSYIAVRVYQWGSSNIRPLLGLHDTPRPLSNLVFPRKISATTSGGSSVPTIDGTTQVNFEADWFTPYIELSESIGVDYRVFTENWPSAGEAQRPWVALTSRGINSQGGYTSATGTGVRVSMYDTPLSTDRVRIRSSVYRTFQSSEPSTLIIRGSRDLQSGLGLRVVPHHDGFSVGRYELISWNNQPQGRDWMTGSTVIGTINVRPSAGHQIEVDYLDGLVTVRINGVPHISDRDVPGHSGAARRFVGIQNERSSTGGLFPSYFPSPWFGPWSARDLPQGDGGEDGDGSGEG